jgi:hypothetical protein
MHARQVRAGVRVFSLGDAPFGKPSRHILSSMRSPGTRAMSRKAAPNASVRSPARSTRGRGSRGTRPHLHRPFESRPNCLSVVAEDAQDQRATKLAWRGGESQRIDGGVIAADDPCGRLRVVERRVTKGGSQIFQQALADVVLAPSFTHRFARRSLCSGIRASKWVSALRPYHPSARRVYQPAALPERDLGNAGAKRFGGRRASRLALIEAIETIVNGRTAGALDIRHRCSGCTDCSFECNPHGSRMLGRLAAPGCFPIGSRSRVSGRWRLANARSPEWHPCPPDSRRRSRPSCSSRRWRRNPLLAGRRSSRWTPCPTDGESCLHTR